MKLTPPGARSGALAPALRRARPRAPSRYPTDIAGLDPRTGESRMQTTPVMCKSEFTGDGLLRHLSAMEIYPPFGPSPVLHPFWAAGISFSRGHFVARVPYVHCFYYYDYYEYYYF